MEHTEHGRKIEAHLVFWIRIAIQFQTQMLSQCVDADGTPST